ncbi:Gfo/Idh/MocA family oxidoreductase [Candidatus Micrarchaeota archaeon]|nr:Gfo/Idh/MocA family oxidoreductase [Candidatus Micrarchaeota archaeon]
MDVLIVGCGAMGRNHVRVFSELPEVKNIFAVDISAETLKSVAQFQKVTTFSNLESALDKKPDCAVLAVPTRLHYEIGTVLLNHKIPLLVEKPITENVRDGLSLIEMARAKKVPLLIGHTERFNPAVVELKKNIHLLGEVIYASAHRFGVPAERDVGSSFIDQAVHDLDVISFLCGQKPKYVFALERKIIDKKNNDLCTAIFEYDSFTVTIEANRVTPIKTRELILLGIKGTAKLDYINQELSAFLAANGQRKYESFDQMLMTAGKGTEIKPYFVKAEPLKIEAEHFLRCVDGKQPVVSGEEAVAAVAAIVAGQLSNKNGKREKINYQVDF